MKRMYMLKINLSDFSHWSNGKEFTTYTFDIRSNRQRHEDVAIVVCSFSTNTLSVADWYSSFHFGDYVKVDHFLACIP